MNKKTIEKAKKIKASHQDEWLSFSSIVSIGIGMIDKEKIGILIGVKGKVETVTSKIPDSIDGVPISIKTISQIRAL